MSDYHNLVRSQQRQPSVYLVVKSFYEIINKTSLNNAFGKRFYVFHYKVAHKTVADNDIGIVFKDFARFGVAYKVVRSVFHKLVCGFALKVSFSFFFAYIQQSDTR